MGAPQQQNSGDIISSINVTPLVDVTLVLLIVFMVTASYIVKAAIDVELPQAQSGSESAGTMMTLIVKQASDGALKRSEPCNVWALDGHIIEEAALVQALKAAWTHDNATKVMISADKDCRHGEFVHAVDLVKSQGITKFAINIERTDAPAPTP